MNQKEFWSRIAFRITVEAIVLAVFLLLLLSCATLFADDGASVDKSATVGEEAGAAEEEGIVLWQKDGLSITLGGLFDAQVVYSYNYARHMTGEGAADIVLAEWHLDLDASYNETLEAHLTLLWEEGDTEPVDLDEGWVRYIKNGLFIGGGKTCLPFGTFDTFFISDPFTLEIAEMRESGVFLGYESDTITLSIMAANGDLSKIDTHEDRLDLWASALDLTPRENLQLRFSYVSNIAEGDGLLSGALALDPFYNKRVGGFHAAAHITAGPFEFVAEVVTPFKPFDRNDLDADGNGHGDRPMAANFEIAFTIEREKETTWRFAARIEGTHQLDAPKLRGGFAISHSPNKHTSITLEMLHHSYGKHFTPALLEGYSVALQLAFEF